MRPPREGDFVATAPFSVRWRDADPAGWIYYANVTRFFDDAEAELFKHFGVVYWEELERGRGFPRVRIECDFLAPLRVGDGGIAEAYIAAAGSTSMTVGHRLIKAGEVEPCVTAAITIVVVDWKRLKPIAVPDWVRCAG